MRTATSTGFGSAPFSGKANDREPPGSLPLGVERAYAGQKNLPAAGQQVADKPADLLFHRVRVHFFFFLGVAAGAFGTGAGTVPGRVAPRQII